MLNKRQIRQLIEKEKLIEGPIYLDTQPIPDEYLRKIREGKYTPDDHIGLNYLLQVNSPSISAAFRDAGRTDYRAVSMSARAKFQRLISQMDPNKPPKYQTPEGLKWIGMDGQPYTSSRAAILGNKKYLKEQEKPGK